MKRAAAFIVIVTVGMASAVGAETYRVGVSIDAEDIRIVQGDMIVSAKGIRSYADELVRFVPPEIRDAFASREFNPDHIRKALARANSTGNAGASGVLTATEQASASAVAVAHDGGVDSSIDPINANALNEVAYDFAGNKRIEIDHGRQQFKVTDTVHQSGNMSEAIIAGAPEGASDNQAEALRNLLGAFSKPRLDPKKEITLKPLNESDKVKINSVDVRCIWHSMSRMGGEVGRVCLADPEDVPNGSDLHRLISTLPLEGAGEDDPVGRVRRLSDTGKLPVIYQAGAPELPVVITTVVMLEDEPQDPDDSDMTPELRERLAVTEQKIRDTLSGYQERAQ